MKKKLTILLAVMGIAIAAAIILMPSPAASSMKPVSAPTAAVPDSIMKIFENSCMDCHSSDGNPMARSHVNFSDINKLPPEKLAAKAMDICKILQKDGMPPKGWRKNNADRIPTDKDKQAICTWASKMNP